MAIKNDGSLWAWGSNEYSQLGDGTTINRQSPVKIGTATNWSKVSTLGAHAIAIKTDGTLWAWGANWYGQIGDGTTIPRTTPIKIGTAVNWIDISSGLQHSIALKTDGTIWGWGWNYSGQLGDGTTTQRNSPVQIGTATNWDYISAGGYRSVGLQDVESVGNPYIKISQSKLNVNEKLEVNGSDFSSNNNYIIQISSQSGSFTKSVSGKSDLGGGITYEITIDNTFKDGNYFIIAVDELTNKISNQVMFTVINPETYSIDLYSPVNNSKYEVGEKINLKWRDKIIKKDGYVLDDTKTKRQYQYVIEYSINNGSWQEIENTLKSGYANFDQVLELEEWLVVINDLLGSCSFRIKDVTPYIPPPMISKKKEHLQSIDERYSQSVITNNSTATNKIVKLKWDENVYSELKTKIYEKTPPLGVAADGTSRIDIEITPPYPASKVEVWVSDVESIENLKRYGKIGDATNSVYGVINGTQDKYTFRYTAPDEFCYTYDDFNEKQRKVKLYYKITTELSSETKDVEIIIGRPPLFFAHGFNAGPQTWDNLKYDNNNSEIKYFKDNFEDTKNQWNKNGFKYYSFRARLGADKSSIDNSNLLLYKSLDSFYDVVKNYINDNELACAKVDYICHSKGGRDLRTAVEHETFYKTIDNYDKGYVNKAIFIDTPHNGSPYADFIIDLCNAVNDPQKGIRARQFAENAGKEALIEQRLTGIFLPIYISVPWGDDELFLKPTIAIEDLAIGGGSKFRETEVKNYLIASDYFLGDIRPMESQLIYTYETFKFNLLMEMFYELTVRSNFKNEIFLDEIKELYKSVSLENKSYFTILDKLVQSTNIADENFLWNSDWIVGQSSQMAGLDYNSNKMRIHLFDKEKIAHSTPFSPVCESKEVGKLIDTLLNSGIKPKEIQFAETIPEDPRIHLQSLPQKTLNIPAPKTKVITIYDSTKVNVYFYSDTTKLFVNNSLEIRVELTDTANFKSMDVYFQGQYLNSIDKKFQTDFYFNLENFYIGEQFLKVYTFYSNNDTTWVRYKKIPLNIQTVDSLTSFSVEPKFNLVNNYYPQSLNFYPYYQTFASKLNSYKDLKFVVSDNTVLEYDSTNGSVTALKTGNGFIAFEYLGKLDTAYFYYQDMLPRPDTLCILKSPRNQKITSNLTTLFEWRVPNNTLYSDFQIAEDSSFLSIVYRESVYNDSSFALNSFSSNGKYYWRVKAVGLGGEAGWSEIWNLNIFDRQSITLKSGWNMISSNIIPNAPDSLQYISAELNPNLVIAKNGAGKVFIPPATNTIGKWNILNGYQVYMTKADTLGIIGTAVLPDTTNMVLNNGWSMISYLRNSPKPINECLATLTDRNTLVIAKNGAGKVFIPPSTNTIGNMIPGEGYQMYLNKVDTLVYPANSGSRTSASNEIQDFDAVQIKTDFDNTGNNASLILDIDLADNTELAVMNSDNKIVGAGKVIDGRTSIVIWGDDESTNAIDGSVEYYELRIMNYDAENGKYIEINNLDLTEIISGTKYNKLTYNKDAVLIGKAIIYDLKLSVNPNPFSNSTEVIYTLAEDCEIELSLFNLSGMKVLDVANGKQNKGTHKLTINSENLSSGTYNVILKSCGKSVVEKVVVVR